MKLIETNNLLFTQVFKELKNEIGNNIITNGIVFNEIGTFKSTRVLGNCHRKLLGGKYCYKISLNKELLKQNIQEIKDVLIHEYLHTEIFNHRNEYKNKAKRLNDIFGYNALHDKFNCLEKIKRNIIYQCVNCGKLYHRARHVNVNNYKCRCGGKLKLIQE